MEVQSSGVSGRRVITSGIRGRSEEAAGVHARVAGWGDLKVSASRAVRSGYESGDRAVGGWGTQGSGRAGSQHRGLGRTVDEGRRGGERGEPPDFPLPTLSPSAASYFDALVALRRGRAPDGVLSWNDLQAAVNQVNAQVQEETDREWSPGRAEAAHPLPSPSAHRRVSCPEVLAVSLINEALDQGSPEKTLSALLLPSAGLDDVHLPAAPRYHLLLVAAKRQKAQVRSASVAGAERASAVGRAVPRMHLGPAQSDESPLWGWRAGGAVGVGGPTARALDRAPDASVQRVVGACAWVEHRPGGQRTGLDFLL